MTRTRTNGRHLFRLPGAEHPDIKRILALHGLCTILIAGLLILAGPSSWLLGYCVGALLISFNLLVLARILPQLIYLRSGAVFSLLFSFYTRLLFTGGVLFAVIYWIELNPLGLLLGLSTILASFLAWGGQFLVSRKQKEA